MALAAPPSPPHGAKRPRRGSLVGETLMDPDTMAVLKQLGEVARFMPFFRVTYHPDVRLDHPPPGNPFILEYRNGSILSLDTVEEQLNMSLFEPRRIHTHVGPEHRAEAPVLRFELGLSVFDVGQATKFEPIDGFVMDFFDVKDPDWQPSGVPGESGRLLLAVRTMLPTVWPMTGRPVHVYTAVRNVADIMDTLRQLFRRYLELAEERRQIVSEVQTALYPPIIQSELAPFLTYKRSLVPHRRRLSIRQ